MVEWIAPAECPDQAHVIAAIERHLGAPPGSWPELIAHVEVVKDGGHGWHMILRTRGAAGAGERVVEGDSCEEIAEAAALMVALALEAVPRTDRRMDVALPVLWAAPALPEMVAPEVPVPRAEQRMPGRVAGLAARPRLAWRVRGTVAYGALALPGMGAGVGAGVAVVRERLRLELSVVHWLTRTEAARGHATAGGRFGLEAATVRGCWRIAARIGAGCLGVELGAMRGAGFGVEREGVSHALWAAPLAGFVHSYAITDSVGIVAAVDYAVALRRPRFVLTGLGQVHQPGASALRIFLGGEARFR